MMHLNLNVFVEYNFPEKNMKEEDAQTVVLIVKELNEKKQNFVRMNVFVD